MNIRKAMISDFDDIKIISDEVRKLHIDGRPDLFKDIYIFNKDCFKTYLDNEDRFCFVIFDDKVVGYALGKVIITEESSNMVQRKIVFIDEIGVKKEYKNLGLGTKLLKNVEKFAKDIKANVIDFKVWDFNKEAINFYNKNGYNVKSYNMEKWILKGDNNNGK